MLGILRLFTFPPTLLPAKPGHKLHSRHSLSLQSILEPKTLKQNVLQIPLAQEPTGYLPDLHTL